MPIPTRIVQEPQATPESQSKIPSATPHQRAISTSEINSAKEVPRAHQRTFSSFPQPERTGQTEGNDLKVKHQASIKTGLSSTRWPPMSTTRSVTKRNTTAQDLGGNQTSKNVPEHRPRAVQPQFTAYQQHFSPKKLAHPASTEAGTASHDSPEDGHLRNELLLLHLLHADSQQILAQFQASSQIHVKISHEALLKQHKSVLALEQHKNICVSHAAMDSWLQQGEVIDSAKLLLFASCIRDLESISADGGRYVRTMEHFETWFEALTLALDSRKNSSNNADDDLLFIKPIDVVWSQEVASLQRKLLDCKQTLADLGDANAGGLYFILANYTRLVDTLLQVLETCVGTCDLVLRQEAMWIEMSMQMLLQADDAGPWKSGFAVRRGTWDDRSRS